jgi:hypothetical protein
VEGPESKYAEERNALVFRGPGRQRPAGLLGSRADLVGRCHGDDARARELEAEALEARAEGSWVESACSSVAKPAAAHSEV